MHLLSYKNIYIYIHTHIYICIQASTSNLFIEYLHKRYCNVPKSMILSKKRCKGSSLKGETLIHKLRTKSFTVRSLMWFSQTSGETQMFRKNTVFIPLYFVLFHFRIRFKMILFVFELTQLYFLTFNKSIWAPFPFAKYHHSYSRRISSTWFSYKREPTPLAGDPYSPFASEPTHPLILPKCHHLADFLQHSLVWISAAGVQIQLHSCQQKYMKNSRIKAQTHDQIAEAWEATTYQLRLFLWFSIICLWNKLS